MKYFHLALTAFLLCTMPLLAHPGHEGGLLSGFAHPFQGWDHVLIMVAVGAWAWRLGGRSLFLIPLGFLGSMAAGFFLAGFHGAVANLEVMAAISAVLASVLLLAGTKPPVIVAAVALSLSGLVHGWLHASELGWASMAPFVGTLCATALLHLVGIAAPLALRNLGAAASRVRVETRRD